MTKLSKFICIIMFSIALFVVGIFDVNASSSAPSTMEYYTASGDLFSYGAPTNITSYTIPFYTLYRSYDGLTYINAMYGQPSNVSGKYFTFYMYSPNNTFRTVSAFIQLSSGDYLSCNIDNSLSTNSIYTATCDLSNFGSSFNVYKYGFQWYYYADASVPETNTSQYRLSKIFYFDNASSYSSQIAQNTSEINENISDSSVDTDTSDSSTSGFSDTTNSSMSDTPVSSMIGLPITFLTGVNNALSSSCTNVNYIELFDYQLVLPCLNLSERLGSVWTIIDTICSCMLIFSIGKSLVGTFARLSDMDTNIMYECYANGSKHRGEGFDD